jgi:hypothetical protein
VPNSLNFSATTDGLAGAAASPGDTLPPLVAAVRAGKPEVGSRMFKFGIQRFPHAELGLPDALFKKK